MKIIIQLKTINIGEGSGRGSGRVGSDFLSAIAGRVGSTFRRVGSGPRKVTHGQLWADLIEVFKILRGFENLYSERFFQVIGDGARRGTVSNCSRRGNYRLDVRKFKFASMVCQEYASRT